VAYYGEDLTQARLELRLLGIDEAEFFFARGYPNKQGRRNRALIVRRNGTDVDFVAVMGLTGGLAARRLDDLPAGVLGVGIAQADGSETLVLSAEASRTFRYAGQSITGQLVLLRREGDAVTIVDTVD